MFFAPIMASAATYYVSTTGLDSNAGTSSSQPWKTIAKVNSVPFSSGDFILFKRGETWSETLIPPSSGNAGSPITFGAYGTGDLPTIDGTGRDYCVSSNKDYTTITDLHFTSANKYCIAHTKWDAHGNILSTPGWIIKNSKFTHCGVFLFGPNTIVQDSVFAGPAIRTAEGAAIVFSGPVSVNCSALRNNISGYTSRGIWFNGVGGAATANDNIIHDIALTVGSTWEGYCINFDGYGYSIPGTVTALRNTIYNCASNGIEMENCIGNTLISGNLIHDCQRAGVLFVNYAAGTNYPDLRGLDVHGIVEHNIIYRCTAAIQLRQVSGVDIWNNVIYDGVGSYPSGLAIFDNGTYYVTDIDFRNNIVGSGMTRTCTTSFALKNHFSAFDNNAVVNPVINERDKSNYLTLAQLQAEGAASHCFTTSPGFVDAAGHDFHLLSSSPCINAGANVGLTQDYEGNTIPQGAAPDIGAFEYVGSAPPPSSTPGDLNNDGKVDVSDLSIVALDFGKTSGFSNAKSDTNNDVIVDIFDIVFVASRFT